MLKILQAAIIPVVLCANLLGNDHGVEKWPKFLGKGIEWGMSSKDATAKMSKKGYKLVGKDKPYKPPFDKLFSDVLFYQGKFLRTDAGVVFKFSPDDKLVEQRIGLLSKESLKTGIKLRDLLVKQYGKPSTEEFVDGKSANSDQTLYEGGGRSLTRKEALASKIANVHYTVSYQNKKTEKHMELDYIQLYCNNGGACFLTSMGPNYFDLARKIRGK